MRYLICVVALMSLVLARAVEEPVFRETPEEKAARLAWWQHDRIGMFIHFGLYSLPAVSEWVKSEKRMSDADYDVYFKKFNPDLLDAGKWAKQARQSGVKYVVLTAKHHDGFCLWDSKFTDYKVTNTPFGRDVVRQFVEAFRKEGLRVGLYYSLLDWHHPDYSIDCNHPRHPSDYLSFCEQKAAYEKLNAGRDMEVYRKYMKDQITELLTGYGRIDIMWFDYSYPQVKISPKGRKEWDSKGIWELVHKLQPWVIIDNRMDLYDTGWGWDFLTPEQFKVTRRPVRNGVKVPWETCQTFSGMWGYARDESTWKSPVQLIELLVDTVSKGGNLMLNVGPTPRGMFDARANERLDALGRWLDIHGRSIYGCTEAPEGLTAPEFTHLTYNPQTRRLYVHLFHYPMGSLACEFGDRIAYAQFLHDGSEVKVKSLNHWLVENYPEAPKQNFILPVVKPDVEVPVIEVFLK